MFNMHSNKGRKVLRTILIVILALAMIVPSIAAYLSM
jgi:hypothetical protein